MQIKRATVSLAVTLVVSLAVSLAAVPLAGQEAVAGAPAVRRALADPGDPVVVDRTRPGSSKQSCTPKICVHWVTSGKHAPSLRDKNHNKVPDLVDQVRTAAAVSRAKYKKAGYREPRTDPGVAGGDQTDIYVRNAGARGSRCLTDNPLYADQDTTWAYCVVDNDFSRREFPRGTPIGNLKVTVAHEVFTAVEMAYDAHADGWLWESTATWAADRVFPSTSRWAQYLQHSPMSEPATPLDSSNGQLDRFPTGTAMLWRYLGEHYREAQGGMPTVVRDVWRHLDSRTGTSDHSLDALVDVLADRGANLATVLASFADANRHPVDTYDGGALYVGAVADPTVDRIMSAASPGPKGDSMVVDHLSSATVRFTPGAVPAGTEWRLNLTITLPAAATKPRAVVTQHLQNGTTVVRTVAASGAITPLPFDVETYRYVEVTVVNASDRTERCDTDDTAPYFTCQGHPVDDNQASSVMGTLVQQTS